MTEDKNPEGRPTKYKPEYCQAVIDYMKQDGVAVYKPFAYEGEVNDHLLGYLPRFFEGFAREIDVNTSTLAEWRKKYKEFSEAVHAAKDIQLEKMAIGMLAGVYNSPAAIFAMKNMFQWAEKSEMKVDGEITHRDDKRKAAEQCSPEELAQRLADATKNQ
jgi:transposase-like protein